MNKDLSRYGELTILEYSQGMLGLEPHLQKELESLKAKLEEKLEKGEKWNKMEEMMMFENRYLPLETLDDIYKLVKELESKVKALEKELDYKKDELRIQQIYFHEECDSHEITKQESHKEIQQLKEAIEKIKNVRLESILQDYNYLSRDKTTDKRKEEIQKFRIELKTILESIEVEK